MLLTCSSLSLFPRRFLFIPLGIISDYVRNSGYTDYQLACPQSSQGFNFQVTHVMFPQKSLTKKDYALKEVPVPKYKAVGLVVPEITMRHHFSFNPTAYGNVQKIDFGRFYSIFPISSFLCFFLLCIIPILIYLQLPFRQVSSRNYWSTGDYLTVESIDKTFTTQQLQKCYSYYNSFVKNDFTICAPECIVFFVLEGRCKHDDCAKLRSIDLVILAESVDQLLFVNLDLARQYHDQTDYTYEHKYVLRSFGSGRDISCVVVHNGSAMLRNGFPYNLINSISSKLVIGF